jgi:hypothetical protein
MSEVEKCPYVDTAWLCRLWTHKNALPMMLGVFCMLKYNAGLTAELMLLVDILEIKRDEQTRG